MKLIVIRAFAMSDSTTRRKQRSRRQRCTRPARPNWAPTRTLSLRFYRTLIDDRPTSSSKSTRNSPDAPSSRPWAKNFRAKYSPDYSQSVYNSLTLIFLLSSYFIELIIELSWLNYWRHIKQRRLKKVEKPGGQQDKRTENMCPITPPVGLSQHKNYAIEN